MNRRSMIIQPALSALLGVVLALSGCGKSEPSPATTPDPEVPQAVQGAGVESPAPTDSKLAHLPEALQKAILQAAKENKLVVVDVNDPTCPFCEEMNLELEKEEVQKALAKDFVLVKIGTGTKAERRIVETFSLVKVPTFLFYKGDGTPVEDFLEGVRSAHVFLVELRNMRALAAGGDEEEVPEDDHPNYGLG